MAESSGDQGTSSPQSCIRAMVRDASCSVFIEGQRGRASEHKVSDCASCLFLISSWAIKKKSHRHHASINASQRRHLCVQIIYPKLYPPFRRLSQEGLSDRQRLSLFRRLCRRSHRPFQPAPFPCRKRLRRPMGTNTTTTVRVMWFSWIGLDG